MTESTQSEFCVALSDRLAEALVLEVQPRAASVTAGEDMRAQRAAHARIPYAAIISLQDQMAS